MSFIRPEPQAIANGALSLHPATAKFLVSALRAGETPRVIHDPGFKIVEKKGRLKL
jgi:hypothetical protein